LELKRTKLSSNGGGRDAKGCLFILYPAFKLCMVVVRLPKNLSGKILRQTMRSTADGEPWSMPATIDDAESLDEVTITLRRLG